MVKNEVKQKELDKLKWLLSEKNNEDMSGCMDYCDACEQQRNGFVCGATQVARLQHCLCAKAYNRLRRVKK